MPKIHDVLLIGAGPAAIAALVALPESVKPVILTGAGGSAGSSKIHPKIDAVARERREPRGIARPLPFQQAQGGALFDTATIGGLANYWGQQFLRYAENDPWPRRLFTDHESYLAACAQIEALFQLSPGEEARARQIGAYLARTPNLLVGSKEEPASGLLAMREAFHALAAARGAVVQDGAALHWETHDGVIRVHLHDGGFVDAHRVILAAGVVGSLRLVMASCPEIRSVRLGDHSPSMQYFLRSSGKLALKRADKLAHFNALTIERIEEGRVALFASLYRMSRASIGLTLAALGLPALLPRTYPPALVDLVTPIQVWTSQSRVRYRLDRHAPGPCLESGPVEADEELARFRAWLSGQGIILRHSVTAPGHGFHYHAGEVSGDGAQFHGLPDFLQERFADRILCADASILSEIGARPHSLTAMAGVYQVVGDAYRC